MAILVYLNENFADQTHLAQEEAAIPIAVARGMDPKSAEWVYNDHDQGRAYGQAAGVAWRRINAGDETDLPHAIDDFARCTEGLVKMFTYHAEREDHSFFPEMARYLSEADDDLIMHVITHIGPPDVSPYIALVADMEEALGIWPSATTPGEQETVGAGAEVRGEARATATVEVIHFRMQEGANEQEFIREDERVGREYTPYQPGFISRESAKNDEGDWVVIVHWESAEDAEASMQKFPNDPTAQRFIAMMDSDTFSMKRYETVLTT
jgi:hypothetical protein